MKVLFDVDLDGNAEEVFKIMLLAGGKASDEKERQRYFRKLTKGIVEKGIVSLMAEFLEWREENE